MNLLFGNRFLSTSAVRVKRNKIKRFLNRVGEQDFRVENFNPQF